MDNFYHDDGTKIHISTNFVVGRIDLGSFIIKKEFLKQYDELRFLKQKLARPNSKYEESDGYFIEYANCKAEKKIIHRQILFMHQ